MRGMARRGMLDAAIDLGSEPGRVPCRISEVFGRYNGDLPYMCT